MKPAFVGINAGTLAQITRFLGALGLAILVSTGVSAKTFTVASSGGSYDACVKEGLLNDFEKEAGVAAKFGSVYYDMGVWKTQQESKSYEWDFSPADLNQVDQLIDNGWLQPIDPKMINTGDLLDFPGNLVKRGNDIYAVASEIFGNVIVYNTDKFGSNPPKSWADVFDLNKYPGKRLFSKSVSDFGVLEMALLADGVEPQKLYPLDVDRALKKLDTIKANILWYESGAQQITLLQQGDAVIGAGWDGRIKVLQKQGGKVGYTSNQAIIRADEWTIPKGGDAELANKFIAFISKPAQGAKFVACISYASPWKSVYPLLPKDQQMTVTPENLPHLVQWNEQYWHSNAKSVTDKFNNWLTH
jgi:putative spermidine/putrescine transport system substrate-binding protein